MKYCVYFLFIFLCLSEMACEQRVARKKIKQASRKISPDMLQRRLSWLVKDSSLYSQLEVNELGIAIYPFEGAKDSGRVECRIYPDEYELTTSLFDIFSPDTLLSLYQQKGNGRWEQVLDLPLKSRAITDIEPSSSLLPDLPLLGWKIAVDPGHISGDIEGAEMEGKYVKMRASSRTEGKAIAFFEPNLTLATALLIRDTLERMGATVLLTREEAGLSIRGKSFEDWLSQDKDSLIIATAKEENWDRETQTYWMKKAAEKEVFKHLYNADDLKARAEKINAFRPDLSLIIHYNIHSPNWDKRDKDGFYVPTDANYCMVFIPGSFADGELAKPEDRLNFLRLLLLPTLEKSHVLATAFMRNSLLFTDVPPVPPNFPLPYLEHFSILMKEEGVYARNLSLTRQVWGPLIYGESLCQDNIDETLRLNRKDGVIEGISYPDRLEDVVQAYVASVMDYVKAHKKSHPQKVDGSV